MKSTVPLRRLLGQQIALLLGLAFGLSCLMGWIAYSSLREVIVNDASRNANINAKAEDAALKAEVSETLKHRRETTAQMLTQLYDECSVGDGLLSSTCALRKLTTFQKTEGLISALIITPRGRHVRFGPPIENKQILGELPKGQLAVFESQTTPNASYLIKAQSNNRTLIARFSMGTLANAFQSERSSLGEIPPEALAPLRALRNRIVLWTLAFAAVASALSLLFARRWRKSLEVESKTETEVEPVAGDAVVTTEVELNAEPTPEPLPADFDTYEVLMKLARLTQVEMKKEKVNLSEIGLKIIGALRETDPMHPVTIKIQPELLTEGDPALLSTVLENLLTNAWKLTARRPNPRVEMGLLTRGQTQVYFVRDNGIGLNTESPEKLFDAFQPGGMGIGLAIARKILRRHAGDIWAEGKPGTGATFFFTIGQPKPQEASIVA